MTDLRMVLTPDGPDLSLVDQDLELDETLVTPSLVTLFSDARREGDDPELPDSDADPRGFWPDSFTNRFGSKLWLWHRQKITERSLAEIKTKVEESFAWMRRDGICASVDVTLDRRSNDCISIRIDIHRGEATQWPQLWEGIGDVFTVGPVTDRFLND